MDGPKVDLLADSVKLSEARPPARAPRAGLERNRGRCVRGAGVVGLVIGVIHVVFDWVTLERARFLLGTRRLWSERTVSGASAQGPQCSPCALSGPSDRAGGDTRTKRSRRTDLVFASRYGTELDAANIRRAFRTVAARAGLDEKSWTPRELRHSFVSLLSSSGMPIEDISHLVGHASTSVTEKVYRKELHPVLNRGAAAMDDLFQPRRDNPA